MTKEQKVLACAGHVNPKSVARMANCSLNYAYSTLNKNGYFNKAKYKSNGQLD